MRPYHAHLWLWGSPKGSGLFSPSMVWGGWWAPGAGTEVVGSLVALWGFSGVTITAALLDALALSHLYEQGRRGKPRASHSRTLGAVPSRSSQSAGTWAPHTPGPSGSFPSTHCGWAGGLGLQDPVWHPGVGKGIALGVLQGLLKQLWGRDNSRARLYSPPPHRLPEAASQPVTCPRTWGQSLSL